MRELVCALLRFLWLPSRRKGCRACKSASIDLRVLVFALAASLGSSVIFRHGAGVSFGARGSVERLERYAASARLAAICFGDRADCSFAYVAGGRGFVAAQFVETGKRAAGIAERPRGDGTFYAGTAAVRSKHSASGVFQSTGAAAGDAAGSGSGGHQRFGAANGRFARAAILYD